MRCNTSYLLTAALSVLSCIPLTEAACDPRFDDCTERRYRPGVWWGISIGILAIVIIIIMVSTILRRRRINRANLAYITPQQGGVYQHPAYTTNTQGYNQGQWQAPNQPPPQAAPYNVESGNASYPPPPGPPTAPPPPAYMRSEKA